MKIKIFKRLFCSHYWIKPILQRSRGNGFFGLIRQYEWKCKKCGGNKIEEVLSGVTQYSVIEDVEIVSGELCLNYGNYNCEVTDDNACEVYYQCLKCGSRVSENELRKLANK